VYEAVVFVAFGTAPVAYAITLESFDVTSSQ